MLFHVGHHIRALTEPPPCTEDGCLMTICLVVDIKAPFLIRECVLWGVFTRQSSCGMVLTELAVMGGAQALNPGLLDLKSFTVSAILWRHIWKQTQTLEPGSSQPFLEAQWFSDCKSRQCGRAGSAVKSTYACRGLGLDSQHPHYGLQQPITSESLFLKPFSNLWATRDSHMGHSHTWKQNTHKAYSRQKQGDHHKFKGRLVYLANYRLPRATY